LIFYLILVIMYTNLGKFEHKEEYSKVLRFEIRTYDF